MNIITDADASNHKIDMISYGMELLGIRDVKNVCRVGHTYSVHTHTHKHTHTHTPLPLTRHTLVVIHKVFIIFLVDDAWIKLTFRK